VALAAVLVVLGIAALVCWSQPKPNTSSAVLEKGWDGAPYFGMYQMSSPQEDLQSYADRMLQVQQMGATVDGQNMTWGMGPSMQDTLQMMFNATKVDGIWEQVPEVFRGLFWLDDSLPEAVVSLQYSQWFPETLTLLVPMAPMMWSWPTQEPALYPNDWTDEGAIQARLATLTINWTLSFVFDTPELKYANMMIHPQGIISLPQSVGACTLVAESLDPRPGVTWYRGNYVGLGACQCIWVGGYQMKKVMDENGSKVLPWYDNFIDYMGKDNSLWVYLGTDVESRKGANKTKKETS